jgi:hypothetical protein
MIMIDGTLDIPLPVLRFRHAEMAVKCQDWSMAKIFSPQYRGPLLAPDVVTVVCSGAYAIEECSRSYARPLTLG